MTRALIVEDEALIRKGLVCSIDWIKYDIGVSEASNGAEGFDAIQKLQPDVVITDIKMPIMDGIEMLEKASRLHADFAAIILTSYGEFEYAQKAIKLGVIDYILKPVDEELLLASVLKAREQLKRRREAERPELPMSAELFPAGPRNEYVEAAVARIKQDYMEKLSLEDIAAKLDVSPSYLSRKFKEEMGHTFLDLLNMYRVQRAVSLLAGAGALVYEAAAQTGFADYKHFCAVFKKYTGLAPTEFIKRWKIHD